MKRLATIALMLLIGISGFSQRTVGDSRRVCQDHFPFPATDSIQAPFMNEVGVFITGYEILQPKESTYYSVVDLNTCEEILSNSQYGHYNWFTFRWDNSVFDNVTEIRVTRYKKYKGVYQTKAILYFQKP